MDLKLRNELKRLQNVRTSCETYYMMNVEHFEEKRVRIQNQLERTQSEIKKELLRKQLEYYEREIEDLDRTIEQSIAETDKQIEQIQNKINELEEQAKMQCESFDFNVDRLREALSRRNTREIFTMFESTLNALTILKKEISSCAHEQS